MQRQPGVEYRGAEVQGWATDLLATATCIMTQLARQLASYSTEGLWEERRQWAQRLGVATRHVEVALHVLAYVSQDRTLLDALALPLTTPEAPLGAIVRHGRTLARDLGDVALLQTLDFMLADMLTEVPSLIEGPF